MGPAARLAQPGSTSLAFPPPPRSGASIVNQRFKPRSFAFGNRCVFQRMDGALAHCRADSRCRVDEVEER